MLREQDYVGSERFPEMVQSPVLRSQGLSIYMTPRESILASLNASGKPLIANVDNGGDHSITSRIDVLEWVKLGCPWLGVFRGWGNPLVYSPNMT